MLKKKDIILLDETSAFLLKQHMKFILKLGVKILWRNIMKKFKMIILILISLLIVSLQRLAGYKK